MNPEIQRLRYYNREYLAAPDFETEQSYHIQMRRRLNLALHLWGIVEGLQVQETELVANAPKQAAILPGMAIDGYGREIVVFAPEQITEELLQSKGVTTGATYTVWLAYKREAMTPAAAHFRDCQLKDQNTRWRESYDVLIKLATYTPPSQSKFPPAFGVISDNPANEEWPVKVGEIHYQPNALDPNPKITASNSSSGRVYIGLRAQRLHPPVPIDDAKFAVLDANESLEPPTSISVEANVFTEKNLVVGPNFQVSPVPTPPPGEKCPSAGLGNVKISSDLFLQGNLYIQGVGTPGAQWLSLERLIPTLVPEVKMGTTDVKIVDGTQNPSSDTIVIKLSSTNLLRVSKAEAVAWIAGVTWAEKKPLTDIMNKSADNNQQTFSVVANPPKPSGPNTFDIDLKYYIGPAVQDPPAATPPNFRTPIVLLKIGYLVIFYP